METCTKFNLDLPRPDAAQEETIYDFYVTEKGFILYKFWNIYTKNNLFFSLGEWSKKYQKLFKLRI